MTRTSSLTPKRIGKKENGSQRRLFHPVIEQLEQRLLLSAEADRFVRQAYRDLLHREADSAGLAAWSAQVDAGVPHSQVISALEGSTEYLDKLVGHLYGSLLGRAPDPSGLNAWVTLLTGGGTVEQVQAGLMGSDEYFHNRTAGNVTGFLNVLYADVLHRPPDAAGFQAFTQALSGGMSRTAVAELVLTSNEGRSVLVEGYYQSFLHRPADPGGLTAFVGALQQGVSDQQVIAAMLGSAEYFTPPADNTTHQQHQQLVGQLFLDLLHRPANITDLNSFTDILDLGLISRFDIALNVAQSEEYRTDVVSGFYAELLGRGPDPAGLAHSVGLLDQGASLEQVRAAFVSSDEYFQNRGGGTNDTFLAAAYQDVLGRSIDPAGKAAFTQALASGISRTTVVAILEESPEYRTNLVQSDYRLLLHRSADPGGLALFVSYLQNGASDEQVLATMAASAEYLTRPNGSPDMQPPVITLLSPVNGLTTRQNITITGQVTDDQTVANLQAAVDTGAFADVSFDAAGNFSFTTTFPLDQSADGAHAIHFRATDAAGNTSNIVDFALTLDTSVVLNQNITLTEGNNFLTQNMVTVPLGQSKGTRTITFQVAPQFDKTDQTAAIKDTFLVYLVDPANPGHTILDRGQPGTALFGLSENGADFTPGLVRFDGATVTIDVSSVPNVTSGLLVFQLLNSDTDNGTVVQVSQLADRVDVQGTVAPVFPDAPTVASAGAALDASTLTVSTNIQLLSSRVRFDAMSGNYVADLQVHNSGPALNRNVAVVFPGLPSGVQVQNPSGSDAQGHPYINFANAIVSGGLASGATSNSIEVVFTSPNQVRFSLVPQFLVAGPDSGPVFTPVGPLTVMAGHRLSLQLQASDADGDPIQFSIPNINALPTGSLQGDGTLLFTPAPSEVGTYNFTVVASDGLKEASQNVSLTVTADPVTTTRVSGVVENTSGQPIAGVPVDVAGVSTTTASDGSFLLDLGNASPGILLNVHGDQAPGAVVYPFVDLNLKPVLGHPAFAGASNVIPQPIFLTPVDTADAVTIDPAAVTTVTTPKLPGASLKVAAGSLKDAMGHPYSGPLGITQVPVDKTPLPLGNVHPDVIAMIQPGGVTFSSPAVLTLPNPSGWAAGTTMDLWLLDLPSGTFTNLGFGKVSADGISISSTFPGVSSSSLYFFLPDSSPRSVNGDPFVPHFGDAPQPQTVTFGSDVELYSGAVRTSHDLVTYQSQGLVHGLQLQYNSLAADPRPIVHFGFAGLPGLTSNDRLVASLHLGTVASLGVTASASPSPGFSSGTVITGTSSGGENYWLLPSGGGSAEAALQLDLSGQPSGVYAYNLAVGVMRLDPNTHQFVGRLTPQGSTLTLINSIQSPFGSGWGLAGLQQIIPNADGSVLLVDGDGSNLLFQAPVGSAYFSPAGDFSKLVKLSDGTFQRTMKDQTVFHFNAQNQLATITDRNGNQTQYLYDANGRLTTIIDPVGLQTTFAYTGNQVTSITDPAQRITQLKYDGAGNLMTVIDPDGSMRSWEYDTLHHMTAETDKRGNRDQDFYDFAGRATHSIRADGSTVQVAPVEVQGLYPPDQTVNAFSTSLPSAVAPMAAVAEFTDGDGNVTTETLDQHGQVMATSDSIGPVETVVRDANGLIRQRTDGLGHQTTFAYDQNGNLITNQDGVSGPFLPQADTTLGFQFMDEFPIESTIADLNHDGAQDFLYPDSSGMKVHIALGGKDATGHPTGRFSAGVSVPTAGFIRQIAVGDLRGNGKMDLITAGQGGVHVFLGKGTGLFDDAASYGDMGPDAVVTGDFNGDGRDDVASANQNTGAVDVALANPDGTLGAITEYPIPGGPDALAVGDLDGVGILDLVTIDRSGNLIVLMGNKDAQTGKGNGTFTALPNIAVQSSAEIALGDLTGNGRLDIVTRGVIVMNNGNGSFTATSHPEIKQSQLFVAQLGGEKHADIIAVANQFGGGPNATYGVAILPGNGDGTFQPEVDLPFTRPALGSFPNISLAVADVNGDGSPDLVAATGVFDVPGALNVSVRLSTGTPLTGNGIIGQLSYTYDSRFNQPTSVTDELGRQKTYTIDPANGTILTATIVVANGTNLVTTYTYTPQGQIATITDPRGIVTTYSYDALGRLMTVVLAQGTPDEATVHYEYDAAGNQTAFTDGNGHRSTYAFDLMNRRTKVHDPLGHDTLFTYDLAGNLSSQTDALGNLTTIAYDPFNRPTLTTLPDPDGPGPLPAPTITRSYDPAGNLIDMVDQNGLHQHNAYDARRRLISTQDSQGGTTVYGYDLNNNTTGVIDPNHNNIQYAYDVRNRLTKETDALGNVATFTYDPADHLISQTDRDGRTITYAYNELDKPVTETWISAGGGTDNVVHMTYDGDGNPLTTTDQSSALTFTYTARNGVASIDNGGTPNAPHVVLAYTYDLAGNVVSASDNQNGTPVGTATYTYDAANRETSVAQSGTGVQNKRVDFGYNQVNALTSMNRFTDLAGANLLVSSTYQYDALSRLTDLVHSHGAAALASYHQSYDNAGRIGQIVNGDGTSTFTYDTLNQLASASHSAAGIPAETYTYDANGNRLTSSRPGSSSIGLGNQLLSDGTFHYMYDKEGNLVQRVEIATGKTRLFQWDERNRLTTVIDQDAAHAEVQRVLFTYDAFNRRIAKEVKTATTDVRTDFIYDRGNVLLDFVSASGAAPHVDKRYLVGPGVDQVLAQEDGAGTVAWFLSDNLGTVRDLVDNNGTIVDHLTYDSFGNLLAASHPALTPRFLFTGREFDAETGLYYYRARYYAADIGRFLNEDPLGLAGSGPNFYAYVRNDPIAHSDPSGMKILQTIDDLFLSLDAVLLTIGKVFKTFDQVFLRVDQVFLSVDQVTLSLDQVTQSLGQVTQSLGQVTQSLDQVTQSIDQVFSTPLDVFSDPEQFYSQ